MVEVKLNKKSNKNPFYGMKNCLKLMNNAASLTIDKEMLNAAFNECKTKAQRQMFYSLLFSIGDITNRQHNIFKNKKRDNGGNANREVFTTIIEWMWDKDNTQFIKFLEKGLFEEYSCIDHLLRNRVKTIRHKVIQVYSMLEEPSYRTVIAKHLQAIINGNNPFNKMLVAKFLSLPRLTHRQGHKRMLPETKKVMQNKVKLLKELSDLMGWKYSITNTVANFIDYRKWRKEYNNNLESVLFSTDKIREFDKTQFLDWYDKLPAQARARVRKRVFVSTLPNDTHINKYQEMIPWVIEWEKFKDEKQQEKRELEEKVRQGQATLEDKVKLEKVKKEAKVNIGATNFIDLYKDICMCSIDKFKLESFMDKVNLPYNSLVIMDDSGSMYGQPYNFAAFIAATCLIKNPDDTARNLLGFFNTKSHWHGFIDKTTNGERPNYFFRSKAVSISPEPFVKPEKSFYENYLRIKDFCNAVFQSGCTNISSIPEGLNAACQKNSELLDTLKCYPIWTIISDGEWNNLPSPESSINDFMKKCKDYFGYKPFIVAIDIADPQRLRNAAHFSGIENFMYIPANPAQIEQFLINFKDMDEFDVYTPLQSLYRSNRYDLIRKEVM